MCWYKQGLYFKCLKCSKCCTGSPGYVWLTEKEIEKISNFLKISKNTFLKKYTRFIKKKSSLKENLKNYDCCFLKDKKCRIYDVRPMQCKTFPFWKNNLKSNKNWQDLKKYCRGIDHKDGTLYSFKKIQKKLSADLF